MMYAKGNDFIKDYAERTLSNYMRISAGPYEVTQLLNSAVGLLIIPQQKQFDKITDAIISEELLQKMIGTVKINTYKKPLNLAEIARHLRNSIAHANIDFVAEQPPMNGQPIIIHSVSCLDVNPRTNEKIEMDIPIELLKEFFFEFAKAVTALK